MIFPAQYFGAATLSRCGQTLSLLPERAIYWHEQQALIVADIHLGKAQTFQRAGIPVPDNSFDHDLERLQTLIKHVHAKSLIVLGDFVHHRSGLSLRVQNKIKRWCAMLRDISVVLVIGNHDKPNQFFLQQLPVTIVSVYEWGPFRFSHESLVDQGGFFFMGHVHPVLALNGIGVRLPAFAFYENCCVLPAFSYFTGGWRVDRKGVKELFVVVEDEVGGVIKV